ncbi:hypothetical protein IMZ31_24215 (plasmid) [Pontibacillus sp. ALD_SL1]|uniref:hypothetical protein n=1 Tax=Pontibacillus sp. ALD_SL1 TaxID=2777185 RepID=UPI001A97C4F3|nr:hypothetical protein [Pontibacillus sp. ALD_SL1]QST02558.1 hypothetical protein IMZ31_24215 [Pontibacillus sp. ALD_SL1]
MKEDAEVHPYLERNNGYELIGGDFWIKPIKEECYQIVILNRFDVSEQKGWVDLFDIDLSEIDQETVDRAWEVEDDVEFDETVVTKEQITAEMLAKGGFIDCTKQNAFTNEVELKKVMKEYGIVDDLELL